MNPHIYRADITRVVDGDTCDVTLHLGFDILYKGRVRLTGIDTPESRTRDLEEKFYGLLSKQFLKELLKGQEVKLISHDKGKFGRIIGDLIIDPFQITEDVITNAGGSVNQMMIDNNHAVPYFGQSKNDTVQGHLWNRAALEEKGIKYLK